MSFAESWTIVAGSMLIRTIKIKDIHRFWKLLHILFVSHISRAWQYIMTCISLKLPRVILTLILRHLVKNIVIDGFVIQL